MADDELTADTKRRSRRVRMLLASIGVVILLAYGLLVRLPPVLIDRAEEKGAACREKIRETGLGDPSTCKIEAGFGGVIGSHRDRAKAVAWENEIRSTALAAELAGVRDLDAAARDRALRAEVQLAGGHDDAGFAPENAASLLGARTVVVEMARAPRNPDAAFGLSSLRDIAVGAALWLGDLGAAAELAPATDYTEATKEALACLGGARPCPAHAIDGWIDLATSLSTHQRGESDEVVARNIVDRHGDPIEGLPPAVHLTKWTLANQWTAFAPADGQQLIAALIARAGPQLDAGAGGSPNGSKSKPPAMVRSARADQLLKLAWILQVELARTRWLLGELDAARADLAGADQMLTDERLVPPRPFATAALRVALWPSDQALAWLETALASATDEARPLLALNRGLLLAELGRFDDALAGLPAADPKCATAECGALEWLRIALQLHAGKLSALSAGVPPTPGKDDDVELWCSDLKPADARAVVVAALAEGGAALAATRWRCRYGIGDEYDIAALPARLYVLGALAHDHDPSPWLELHSFYGPLRLEHAALAQAATWRGDAAAAKLYADRAATLSQAFARAPAWANDLGL